ncbi:MAG TPA: sialidase family protein, partial [Tepidisphaeraceae bacterium]|nr:sialidase family protein [Tepidisphaeraceae bacterium]
MLTHIFRMLIALAVGVSYAADTVAADDHAAHGGHGAAAHPPAVATGVTSLDVYADGSRLHVLTAVRDGGGGPRLQYVHSNDGGVTWSAAVDVPDAGTAPQVTRGADAHVAAAGDRLVAAWTAHSATDRFGSGGLATAVSGDGGRTWRVGPNPVDDPSDAGRAFVDVAAGAD